MDISKEDIKHLAELSRLKLSEAEVEKYQKDAEEIVGFFDQLKEAPVGVDGASLSSNGADEEDLGENVSEAVVDTERVDRGTDKESEQFMSSERGYLKVPKVFE